MFDASTSLDSFLTAAAAKKPTPGGGSVTALVGALAASMGEMVLNYSIGKKDLAAYAPGEIQSRMDCAAGLRARRQNRCGIAGAGEVHLGRRAAREDRLECSRIGTRKCVDTPCLFVVAL